MRLQIEHITVFTYDQLISEAYTEMRLRPLDTGGQRCLSFAITPQPREEVRQYVDRFGNGVHHFDVLSSHRQLVVTAASHVLTPDTYQPETSEIGQLDEFDYCRPTDYTPYSQTVAEFAAAQAVPGDTLATALALTAAVNGALKYEKGVTDVQTTAEQALALGRGVCQDFTHVMLAACRSLDLPARYVSGYLYNNGHSAASHAWVDVHIPGPGLVSIDPTHNRQQTVHYVRVAIGRDHGDVPPPRGVFKGQATETLEANESGKAL